jgi:hypothetical protein
VIRALLIALPLGVSAATVRNEAAGAALSGAVAGELTKYLGLVRVAACRKEAPAPTTKPRGCRATDRRPPPGPPL